MTKLNNKRSLSDEGIWGMKGNLMAESIFPCFIVVICNMWLYFIPYQFESSLYHICLVFYLGSFVGMLGYFSLIYFSGSDSKVI